jgi:hypothetical protein
MKKKILIILTLTIGLLSCNLLSRLSMDEGPNPTAQKQMEEALVHQQETQMAQIGTQVAQSLLGTQQSLPTSTPVTPTLTRTPTQSISAADKTATVAQLLTQSSGDTAATDQANQEQSGFVNPYQTSTLPPPQSSKASDGTDFTGAQFKAFSQPEPRIYGITIDLVGPVGGNGGKNFNMKVNGNPMDKCSVPLENPNRLFCRGKEFQGGKHLIQVYESINGQETLLFSTYYAFPSWTSTPAKKPTKGTEEAGSVHKKPTKSDFQF